jgi:hypothetical protein
MPVSELDKAISDAADKIQNGEKETTEEKPEVTLEAEAEGGETEEDASGDTSEESTEDELSDSQKDESFRLYKALRDPSTSGPIIAALAQQIGLFKPGATETRAEERAAAKDVKTILGEALGEYKFLADKLGPAIETILAQERETQEVKFHEIQQNRVEAEVVTAYDRLSRDTKGESRKLEARMATLSEEMPIGTMSVETYIKRLYAVASGEKSRTPTKVVADKIRRNANDASSRLQSTRGAEPERQVPKGKMNINQAVSWALGEMSKEK